MNKLLTLILCLSCISAYSMLHRENSYPSSHQSKKNTASILSNKEFPKKGTKAFNKKMKEILL